MEIPNDVVALGGTVVNSGLLLYIWNLTTERLKKVEESLGKDLVTKESCLLKSKIMDERFENTKIKLNEIHLSNKEDFDRMYKVFEDVNDALSNIQECVTKLSAGIDCD